MICILEKKFKGGLKIILISSKKHENIEYILIQTIPLLYSYLKIDLD